MRTHVLVLALLGSVALVAAGTATAAEAPVIEWQKLLGGVQDEWGYSMQPTADGGCILLGFSISSRSGDVDGPLHGYSSDYWVTKLSGTGSLQWQTLLGGTGTDDGWSVRQAPDGGYILLGYSSSSANGDVTGVSNGDEDFWLVKLAATGDLEWQRLLGGRYSDYGCSVWPTTDGGYVLAGYSGSSRSGDIAGANNGGFDAWVVRVNSTGAVVWEKLLGGASADYGQSVQQTSDGGFILLGYTASSRSGDVTDDNRGGTDLWVVRLSGTGTVEWQRLLGGSGDDRGRSVRQALDGGYVLVGSSSSPPDGDIGEAGNGGSDYWVVKLDGAGTVQWQRLLGGSGSDYGLSVDPTADGGYLLCGHSFSSASGDVSGTNHGDHTSDIWAVKLDGNGELVWQRLLGGSESEEGWSGGQCADGGYLLFGTSSLSQDGDVTGPNHGPMSDFWVVKLGHDLPSPPPVAPVPPSTLAPTDTDADELCDDVNGNGRKDFADVVLYFNRMAWIAVNEPGVAFDYNGNGRIDFADVVWLFTHL